MKPSVMNSFRLGSGAGVLCQMQSKAVDPALKGMFDRSWTILCRDASAPIGQVYALRNGADDPVARVSALRADRAQCPAPAAPGQIADLGAVQQADCALNSGNVGYRTYSLARGRTTYIAEGLSGYDSPLQLALRTIIADRIIPGEIAVATTSVADPAAFARVQAGNLDLDAALQEGYRRNNSGSYAEAAEFFDTLLQRAPGMGGNRNGEYLVNRALQKSNLGEFAEADGLFAQASLIPTADPVQLRLRRNLYAIHLLNQQKLDAAVAELDRPLAAVGMADAKPETAEIDALAASEINTAVPMARQLGLTENASLTADEKVAILDAQALELKGTIQRLRGDLPGAQAALTKALADLIAIREGRVVSITRLRGQTMAELAAVAEANGDLAGSEKILRDALALLEGEYPNSAAANASKARLAAFLGRRGQSAASLALYREVVAGITASGGATTGYDNLLAPYFALLAREIPANPALVDDFFLASETIVRPGVADTQAILARELSGGSDEASRLFRQSVTLTRDIERSRIEIARLSAAPQTTPEEKLRLDQLRTGLTGLEADQIATQNKLAEYPRYSAISTQALTLADLRKALKPDEAYLKLAIVGNDVYGIYADAAGATAFAAPIKAKALETRVAALRDTIVKEQDGQLLTFPFDVAASRALYLDLFGPVADRLGAAKHLVFEPDGAMLQLPANLLVTEQAGVDAYLARNKQPNADEFDFTGIKWLGRSADVSTAVSARGFRDVRNAAPSSARREYLGFGQNAPLSRFTQLTATRSLSSDGAIDCNWPLSEWNKPIAATELRTAQSIIGATVANVVTGSEFSDTAVKSRDDLADYRILHFATHGLVTAPRPECPARPALLTSFGGAGSDGLLTFSEIYDLRLNADLVILSACDTAGKATVEATREVGVTRGGGSALDGLVRAFVGAGGRSVLASHWPAPDDFRATERLISGLFDAQAGTSVAEALRVAQVKLMDEAATSHPYYWAGFSIVGDGAQPVLRAPASASRPGGADRAARR
ncbi:CHAT domain-containing protein [Sphingomonas sp. 1P06PA]|uniref:CHAT domain-containing protein n=1 Tax=Sphingomonas sp. 1P06PA TaxID=554121 RepID=UPI0039A40FDC